MSKRVLLLCGDIAALTAFGMLGLASHEKSVDFATLARSLLPFLVSWLAVGTAAGAFSDRAVAGRITAARLIGAWLAAGVVGLVARAVVFDRELFNAFFAIALVGNGLFLGAWRAIYSRWTANRPPEAGSHLRTEQA
jgi:hypothetical protein